MNVDNNWNPTFDADQTLTKDEIAILEALVEDLNGLYVELSFSLIKTCGVYYIYPTFPMVEEKI